MSMHTCVQFKAWAGMDVSCRLPSVDACMQHNMLRARVQGGRTNLDEMELYLCSPTSTAVQADGLLTHVLLQRTKLQHLNIYVCRGLPPLVARQVSPSMFNYSGSANLGLGPMMAELLLPRGASRHALQLTNKRRQHMPGWCSHLPRPGRAATIRACCYCSLSGNTCIAEIANHTEVANHNTR
jgi:hypothetical protein